MVQKPDDASELVLREQKAERVGFCTSSRKSGSNPSKVLPGVVVLTRFAFTLLAGA